VVFRSCVTCHSVCNKSTSQASLFLCPSSTNRRFGSKNLVCQSFYYVDASTYNGLTAASPTHVAEEKVGVLLLNLGGPETLDDVQPFLFNLFADPVC
jgi:protoporphyrin/coproporphyrin ferrochelatase